jgi:type IX secretion system substrate protein
MKKTYLILLMTLVASVSLVSQNLMNNGTLESWDNATTPTSWDIFDNIAQESATVYQGTYSAAQTSDDASQKFRQDVFNVIGGQEYVISYYYLDNSTSARTRIWSYWMENGTYLDDNEDELRPSTYSEENSEWQHFSVTLTAPLNANEFRFDVRTYKQDGTFGGTVYFDDFSVSGDVVVYPEPSNYPTMFSATAAGLSINIDWTESIGDQLPTGYLLLGEKTGKMLFDVPVDGNPVDTDLDWSDNKVSVNVGYGSGEYIFDGLATNGTYSFTIYPFTNSGSNIDYKTDGSSPEANATTANVSVINSESFDSDLGNWTQYNVTGDQIWEWASFGDPPGCAKGNGYMVVALENEDWLISPELDLEGYTNIAFGFDHARNYGSNEGLFVMISNDYDGSSDPNTATWDDLTASFTFPDQGSWSFEDAGSMDITGFSSDATYIAFIYNSTTSEASTWEIDNIEILGVIGTGISSNIKNNLKVYPNPASGFINIELDKTSMVRVLSITGKLVIETNFNSGKNSIGVQDLTSGIYLIETIDVDGKISTGKFSVK